MSSKVDYRFADLNDLDALVSLRLQMQTEVAQIHLENELLEVYLLKVRQFFQNSLSQKTYYAVLALVDDKIVGNAGVCFYHKPPSVLGGDGVNGYVTNVYTQSDYRGLGIGKGMLRRIVQLGQDLHVDKLHLGSTELGEKIYQDVGFKIPKYTQYELRVL